MSAKVERKQSLLPGERLAVRVVDATEVTGLSEDAIRRAINSGRLTPRWPSKNLMVIRIPDLDEWLDNLPIDRPE